ncbi:hypothetical protein Pyn_19435 [Prunus yedoensis var. nudiflora]|uniref:Uncharacterized protein n=1 Tax=Prunus yedoensis var. nudiflora TaxID=2094558 RepID=A0A314Y5R4_PRUYE|nr:hypothetical protein Pyn_19435 [Prunus yedoensis var. nudiflora]
MTCLKRRYTFLTLFLEANHPTGALSLGARPFYKPVLASEFVDQYFDYLILDGVLGDIGYSEVTKALKGLKVALTYRDNKAYRITGFSTKPLSQLT